MNRIFKTLWNRHRSAYVAVGEHHSAHKKAAAAVAAAVFIAGSAGAADLDFRLGDFSGSVDGYDNTLFRSDVETITINGINNASGKFLAYAGVKPGHVLPSSKDYYLTPYGEAVHAPTLTVNGDTYLKALSVGAVSVFNGNITIGGSTDIDYVAGTTNYCPVLQENYDAWQAKTAADIMGSMSEGLFFVGTSYNLGGTTVNGNVSASVIAVGSHLAQKIDQYYLDEGKSVGGLIVNGNIESDFLVVDVSRPGTEKFDRYTEYMEVNGTAHIRQNVYIGGRFQAQKLIVDGTLYNSFGQYYEKENIWDDTDEGVPSNPPWFVGTTVDELDALHIVNANNLNVGRLTNTRSQTYTQTFGQISVKDNWFSDSTINLSGGYINENALGPDGNLGNNNVFNVSGGTLRVKDFQYRNSSVNLSGDGNLEAPVQAMFEKWRGKEKPLNVVGIDAAGSETVRTVLTQYFTDYQAPTVIENLLGGRVSLTGGHVVLSGVDVTETQAADMRRAFREKFGTAATLEFTGNISGVSTDDVFNIDRLKILQTEVADLSDVTYVDKDLLAENRAVRFGNGDDSIFDSTGFRSISDAASIEIAEGRKLQLVGTTDDPSFVLTEAAVTVNGNSTFMLGSLALGTGYAGTAGDVTVAGGTTEADRGRFTTANGTYTVGRVTAGNAVMRVMDSGHLTTGDLAFSDDASLRNEGILTVNGTLSSADDGNLVIENSGNLTVSGNTTVNGSFTNAAGAEAHLKDAWVNGTLTNAAHALLEANDLTVKGQLANFGNIEASDTSSVFGVLTNNGTIRLYDTEVGNRGTLNNTHTLTQTGTLTVSGKLANALGATAALDDVTLTGDGAFITNRGTLSADRLTVAAGTTFTNGSVSRFAERFLAAAPRAAQDAVRKVGNITLEGTDNTNAGTDYFGAGTVSGTYAIASSGESYLGASSEFADGVGFTVTETGRIDNAGSLTFGGTLKNAGTIAGNGSLAFVKAADGRNTFENSGTISAGSLTADQVKFTQTAGSLTATSGWFSNSEISVTGGEMASSTLGLGNTYTVGAEGSTNSALFRVGTLTSASDLTIREGGEVRADVIDMTGHKTTHLLGGTLATKLDQIFGDITFTTPDIDAENPDDLVHQTTVITAVGDVKTSVAEGIEFGWGTVAFDDANYSTRIAADVLAKLQAVDEGYEGKTLEVAFRGSSDTVFDVDVANRVQADKDGNTAFGTFVKETLTNRTAANPAADTLIVGSADAAFAPSGTANVLGQSMGFMAVTGVTGGLWVNDGKQFVLVGSSDNNALADGDVIVGGASADGTASKVTLGSYGSADRTKGHLDTVWVDVNPASPAEGGASAVLAVRNGDFTIGTLHNGGLLTVGGDGTDNPLDHTASLTVDTLDMVGASHVVNDGVLNVVHLVSHADTGNHEVRNREGATLNASEIDLNGRLVNAGTLIAGDITLGMRGSENTGTLTTDNLTILGESAWGNGATASGRFVNAGTLRVNDALDVAGAFVNEGNASVYGLAVSGTAENAGKLVLEAFKVEAGGTLSNAAGGELGIAAESVASQIEGTFANTGTLTVAGKGLTILENGRLDNEATLNAESLKLTGGTFNNTAEANLNNFTITAGLFTNSGMVKAFGVTTIDAADAAATVLKNTGTMAFVDLQLVSGVVEGGTLGSGDSKATVGIDGSIRNADVLLKELTHSGTSDLTSLIAETVTNDGTLAAGAITADTVVNSGRVTTTGETKIGTLTNDADGSFSAASGELFFVTNRGDFTVTGNLAVNGTNEGTWTVAESGVQTVAEEKAFINQGDLDVKGTLNVEGGLSSEEGSFSVSGFLKNAGKLIADALDVLVGGTVETVSDAAVKGKALSSAGDYVNGGTSVWESVDVTDGTVTNTGYFKTDELHLTGGTLAAEAGTVDADKAIFSDGSLVVGNAKTMEAGNKATVAMVTNDPLGGTFKVIGNGELAIGEGASQLARSLNAPSAASRLTLTQTVELTGSMMVGTSGRRDATGLGSLTFTEDGVFLLDSTKVDATTAAITGSGALTVADGATLILGNIADAGRYLITDGFDTAGLAGWNDKQHLYALPANAIGLAWVLNLGHNDSQVWVDAHYADVRTLYPDVAIPENVNDTLENRDGSAGDVFIWDTLATDELGTVDKTHQINSVAEIAAAAGVLEAARGDLTGTLAAVEDRVSFAGEHFNQAGYLVRETHGGSVWIDVTGGKRRSEGYEATGRMKGGHKTDSYGFVLGADGVNDAGTATFGAAVAYTGDTVKSSGDWLATNNKSKSWSLTGYTNWSPLPKMNVIASATWQHTMADVSQNLLGGGHSKAEADVKANLFALAGRVEYRIPVAGVNVIPHVGVRGVWNNTARYGIHVDGGKAFDADPHQGFGIEVPVGVAVRSETETASGWKLRAAGDVTLTGTVGDTAEQTTIRGARGITDVVEADFLGRYSGSLKLNFQAEKGPATVGLDLGASAGEAGQREVNGKVNVRIVF